jgi:hypothetical protein
VGLLGQAEYLYAEFGRSPKLELTGRLEGTFRDRPVQLEAGGRELTVRVPDLRSAWALRRGVAESTLPMLRAIRDSGLKLTLRIGSRWALPILPEPHVAVRLTLPSLSFSD